MAIPRAPHHCPFPTCTVHVLGVGAAWCRHGVVLQKRGGQMAQPNATPAAQGYDLVVIGSSAGGIEALSTLVANLPTDFAAALVIAQHLDPDHVSHLGNILARRTSLAVRTVLEQEALVLVLQPHLALTLATTSANTFLFNKGRFL